MTVNWIAAFNYLFASLNKSENTDLYVGGPTFCRMVQQVDPGSPSYQQLLALRQQQGKSNSRKDFYWDLIQGLPEEQRFRVYRVFVDHIEPHDKAAAENIRNIVFGGGQLPCASSRSTCLRFSSVALGGSYSCLKQ